MTRMVRDHPLGKPVQPADAILFSDVRLHIALVSRKKNPHIFSPHVIAGGMVGDRTLLSEIARSEAIVRLRFLSEEPLTDDKHLRFMPHLALATASLCESPAIYDVVSQRAYGPKEFSEEMDKTKDLADPNFHVRVLWDPTSAGGRASTRGLVKVGVSEVETADTSTDQQVLIMEVLEHAAAMLFKTRTLPESLFVQCFGDTFELQIKPEKTGPAIARIVRIQTS